MSSPELLDRWEYMTLALVANYFGGSIDNEKFTQRLHELGREGWELVSTYDTNMREGQTLEVIAVLKRKIT